MWPQTVIIRVLSIKSDRATLYVIISWYDYILCVGLVLKHTAKSLFAPYLLEMAKYRLFTVNHQHVFSIAFNYIQKKIIVHLYCKLPIWSTLCGQKEKTCCMRRKYKLEMNHSHVTLSCCLCDKLSQGLWKLESSKLVTENKQNLNITLVMSRVKNKVWRLTSLEEYHENIIEQ